jgi:hypothetical protein
VSGWIKMLVCALFGHNRKTVPSGTQAEGIVYCSCCLNVLAIPEHWPRA